MRPNVHCAINLACVPEPPCSRLKYPSGSSPSADVTSGVAPLGDCTPDAHGGCTACNGPCSVQHRPLQHALHQMQLATAATRPRQHINVTDSAASRPQRHCMVEACGRTRALRRRVRGPRGAAAVSAANAAEMANSGRFRSTDWCARKRVRRAKQRPVHGEGRRRAAALASPSAHARQRLPWATARQVRHATPRHDATGRCGTARHCAASHGTAQYCSVARCTVRYCAARRTQLTTIASAGGER
jgi:hypothetical protein